MTNNQNSMFCIYADLKEKRKRKKLLTPQKVVKMQILSLFHMKQLDDMYIYIIYMLRKL